MFNRKSSYALNKKDPDAIVYMDANEVIVRLTREDFASEKEFLKWKALSDEDYHASEKEAHVYVFIAAVNNRIIPMPSAINKTDVVSEAESITSEKCLLYVAMTRAQKGVYITSYGRPSEFLG